MAGTASRPLSVALRTRDHAWRRALESRLRGAAGIALVAGAGAAEEDEPCDVLIADWRDADGFPALPPRARPPAWIALIDKEAEAIAALRAGADAVLRLAADPAATVAAIAAIGGAARPRAPEDSERPALTPREIEILGALADGASNKAIARRLGLSFHTVKFHVAAILAKLGAESRTEAVAQAARLGLVML